MFKLDNAFLEELGLGSLPAVEKNKMLAHIYETLEMRVGMKLAEQMSNEQLDEFESYINKQDEAGALKWLETNFPNYKQVVAEELEKLKSEISQVAPQIVAQSQAAATKQPTEQIQGQDATPVQQPQPQQQNPQAQQPLQDQAYQQQPPVVTQTSQLQQQPPPAQTMPPQQFQPQQQPPFPQQPTTVKQPNEVGFTSSQNQPPQPPNFTQNQNQPTQPVQYPDQPATNTNNQQQDYNTDLDNQNQQPIQPPAQPWRPQ